MPRLQHKASNDIAVAARRMSINQVVSSIPDPKEEERKRKAAVAKKERRKKSIERLFVTPGARECIDGVVKAAIEDLQKEEDEGQEHTPVSKLQAILTKAKEMESAERLFEYFVPDNHRDGLISHEAFSNAMKSISPEFMQPPQNEIDVQFDYLDTNHDGNVDISEFMEFCMAIPTLPWKAEKTRQLGKSESTDTIVDAARNIERRKSIGKTIPIGEKLYEGRKFFWRTQEDVDICIHENEDYGLIVVSTRSHKSGKCYPPLLVEVTKLDITSKDVAIATEEIVKKQAEDGSSANGSGLSVEFSSPEHMKTIKKKTRNDMITEYILKRLKVPDSVNKPPPLSPQKAAATAPAARTGPFLQKLSTDKGGNIMCQRGITIAKPYDFPPIARRNSAIEFQRLTVDCSALLNEAETFIESAAEQVYNLESIAESAGPGTSVA